jgi:ribosome-associated protein
MTALQDLGERLLKLPPAKLRALPIPEQLIEAVVLAQRIANSREGLRRQRQYIGRLMRDVDAGPLQAALDGDGAAHRAEVAAMHAAERWRERLLNANDSSDARDALDALRDRHGEAAVADIGRLVAGARAELAGGAAGRHYRELYRALRALLAPSSPDTEPAPTP